MTSTAEAALATPAAVAAASLPTMPMSRATLGRTFWAMLTREARVLRRNAVGAVLRVVLQPLLFVFVFSYVMPKIGGFGAGGVAGSTFATILVPGLVASAVITQAMLAVVFPLIMELSWQKSITDRVLAPLPIPLLAVEKIVAAALQAVLAGLLVFPAVLFVHADGQAPMLHIHNWPLFVVMLLGGALLAASAGLYFGTIIDPRQVSVLFTLILLPASMLGCVYYPWSSLEHVRWLQIGVLANPLVYVSEGLRAAITPQVPHLPAWAYLIVTLGGTGVFGWLATRSFTRRVLS
jgi:ABC-type multidrug transport system permease subunit